MDGELAVDAGDVRLDRLFADEGGAGDLAGRESSGGEPGDPCFGRGQLAGVARVPEAGELAVHALPPDRGPHLVTQLEGVSERLRRTSSVLAPALELTSEHQG